MAMQRGKPGRGWRKTQFAQGEICRATGVVGKGEGRSGSSGRAVSQRAGGNCIAIVSVRPVVLKRPERVESAAWLLLSSFQQLCRSGGGTARVDAQLQPLREGAAKQVNCSDS